MKKYIVITMVVWVLAVILSLFWNIKVDNENQEDLAFQGAKSFFKQVVLSRSWNAGHGGVYVPISDKVQPNPYLEGKSRDVTSTEGLELTKINPAFMTRQIAEIAMKEGNIRFHITSLNPIRPANKAEDWETRWLKNFEHGDKEFGEFIVEPSGKRIYRYMAPLITKKNCLKCHAKQGYKEGDIRGGISVTLPFEKVGINKQLWWSHILAIAAGLIGLFLFGVHIERSRAKILKAHRLLQESQAKLLVLEREQTEKQMAGGFAHEMRNALGGSKLLIEETLGHDGAEPYISCNLESSQELKKMYDYLKDLLPKDQLEIVLSSMKKIFANEEHMDKILKMIYQSTKRALSITQQIMDYSKIGHEKTQEKPVDIDQIIRNIAREHQEALKKDKNITLQLDLKGEGRITGQESHFYTIINNIVLNARDALWEAHNQEEPLINISSEKKNRLYVLSITDNGIGIPSGNLPRIYEAFFSTKPESGTGLGLGMVQKMVSIYKGSINVESEVDKGTTFIIEFPLNDDNVSINNG